MHEQNFALVGGAIFREGAALGVRAAASRQIKIELLPEEIEPDALYQEDDEECIGGPPSRATARSE